MIDIGVKTGVAGKASVMIIRAFIPRRLVDDVKPFAVGAINTERANPELDFSRQCLRFVGNLFYQAVDIVAAVIAETFKAEAANFSFSARQRWLRKDKNNHPYE